MGIAWWIKKARDTHPEYVTLISTVTTVTRKRLNVTFTRTLPALLLIKCFLRFAFASSVRAYLVNDTWVKQRWETTWLFILACLWRCQLFTLHNVDGSMIVNLARIWKEATVAEILLHHFSGGTEQNHANISSEIIDVLAAIRNGHLLSTNLRTDRCTDLLSMTDYDW